MVQFAHERRVPPGFDGVDSMVMRFEANRDEAAPSIVPGEIATLSDDECVERLARAVAAQDSERLDEVAQLIGRLAVTIE
jgi:hypothetical protein